MNEYMGWPGHVTHRQHVTWLLWMFKPEAKRQEPVEAIKHRWFGAVGSVRVLNPDGTYTVMNGE